MGSLWRSEDMVMVQMTMQREAAHDTVSQLGEMGMTEFIDLSADLTAFQRPFVNQVKRCEELSRMLRYFQGKIQEAEPSIVIARDKKKSPKLKKKKKKSKANKKDTTATVTETTAASSNTVVPQATDNDITLVGEENNEEQPNHILDFDSLGDIEMKEDPNAESLDSLEAQFADFEQELRHLQTMLDQMNKEQGMLEELEWIVKLSEQVRTDCDSNNSILSDMSTSSAHSTDVLIDNSPSDRDVSHHHQPVHTQLFDNLTGVIPTGKVKVFAVLIMRATRGNSIPHFTPINEKLYDPVTKKFIEKSVFTIYLSSMRAKEKIKKICEAIGAVIHDYPDGEPEQIQGLITQKINDINFTISGTKQRMRTILSQIASHLIHWKKLVARETSIYNILNMFDYSIQGSAIGEAWVPKKHLDKIRDRMDFAAETCGALVPSILEEIATNDVPPTYFELNKFTSAFQDIVNSYGVPRYKELNPAVMTIITFPFLFAIMFGDYGHGIIFTLFSLALVVLEKPLKRTAESSELFAMIYHGRYIMTLMGLFSIYTGLLYNDCFGLSFDIFGSKIDGWTEQQWGNYTRESERPRTYPFGVDPAWYGTSNKLQYYNTMKMKISVIFGVAHMMIGILFSGLNHIYFGHYFDLFVEFIPEALILLCTFGYMDLLIIWKWCRDWRWRPEGTEPPGILPIMTDFFLSPWTMKQYPVFKSKQTQQIVQLVLLVIAAVCIPILLLPKPIYEYIKNRRRSRALLNNQEHQQSNENPAAEPSERHDDMLDLSSEMPPHVSNNVDVSIDVKEAKSQKTDVETEVVSEPDEPFSELFIRQLIHTIDFALGAVSNTASYLRLWALSLAHSQLSEVFWDMTMGMLLSVKDNSPSMHIVHKALFNSGIAFVPIFAIWFLATIGVLLIMESLSAFLHALRLHWVEFNNKFFTGDGRLFAPLSFEDIDDQAAKLIPNPDSN